MKLGALVGLAVAMTVSVPLVAGQDQPAGRGRGGRGARENPPGMLQIPSGDWRPGAKADIAKVTDGVWQIMHTSTNVTVFATGAGLVVVDSGHHGWGPEILDKIKSVTSEQIVMHITTHVHGDHSEANTELGDPSKITFVAHEKTKEMLAQADCTKLSGPARGGCEEFKGENVKYLPTKTYKDRLSLKVGTVNFELYNFGPGHTAGDTVVVVPSKRVAVVGDLFAWKGIPRLFNEDGGSAVRFAQVLKTAQSTIKNVDLIVTGHSIVMKWQDWVEQRELVESWDVQVKALHKAGKTIDEAVAAMKFPDKFQPMCPPNDTFVSQHPEDYPKFHSSCTWRTDQLRTDTAYAYDELNKK